MPATLFDPGEPLAVVEPRPRRKMRLSRIEFRNEANLTHWQKGKLWEEKEAALEERLDRRSEAELAALAAGYDRLRFGRRGQPGLAH
ncbi:MAG TPA: hypothetical protein VH092_12340 [Urbifossiella sp.]|jgi:hypothetical protein|nr:hypothetical protein [Urbifossiella sp.]